MSVHVTHIELPANRREHVLWLMSDEHIGAALTDHAKIEADLSEARRRKARILSNGDLLDSILPGDKRFGAGVLHPRIASSDDIVGASIDWAVELFGPVKRSIDMIGQGNHTQTILKKHSFDPVSAVCERLGVTHGGYTGIVRYSLADGAATFTLAYSHGAGGGSGLAAALGEFEKKSFVEGADALWLGHRHIRVASQVERLSAARSPHGPQLVKRSQWLLRTGGYLDAYPSEPTRSSPSKGPSANYLGDSLAAPYGLGGLFLVLTPTEDGASFTSRVELS